MKMPSGAPDAALFAPCGMDCMVCYRHCAHKKPCAGCLRGDAGKPGHCRACPVKDCVEARGLAYCFQCPAHPCQRIKRLEKSYRTRYGASLMENSAFVQAHGAEAFLALQKERFACPVCGGVVSIHDRTCSECGAKPR